MENKTARLLSIVAFVIWIVGGIGSIICSSSVSSAFTGTLFEDLGRNLSLVIFISSAFSVFTSGLIFFGLAEVIKLIEVRLPCGEKSEQRVTKAVTGGSSSDDVFKF